MKKLMFISVSIIAFIGLTAMLHPVREIVSNQLPQGEIVKIDLPDSILKIVENSCFDCHSDRSGNFAAKGKLNFSGWNDYTPAKKVTKMDNICEMITKGKMPKKKYVSKNPDKALTKAQKDLICKWAAEESKKMLGE
jgi:hypothetical protein